MKTNHIQSRVNRLLKQININKELTEFYENRFNNYYYHTRVTARTIELENQVKELTAKYQLS